ncbi:hypothetical protein [Mesorhizobium sp. A556]
MIDGKRTPQIDLDTELMLMDLDDALFDMNESGERLDELWEQFRLGNVPADLHDDAPLTLEMAVCLPEMQGKFTVNPNFRSKSETMTVRTLRDAIRRKDLECRRPNKNIFVTRRQIREWLEKCPQDGKSRTSSSSASGKTSKAVSLTRQPGSSRTETVELALSAARTSMKPRS